MGSSEQINFYWLDLYHVIRWKKNRKNIRKLTQNIKILANNAKKINKNFH